MADFSKIKELDIQDDATAVYSFSALPGNPKITVRPTNRFNKQWISFTLNNPSIHKALKHIEDGSLETAPAGDLDVFIDGLVRYVILDWSDMDEISDEKKPPCDKENKRKFLAALCKSNRGFIFDLILFCANENNFLSLDVEEKAKN